MWVGIVHLQRLSLEACRRIFRERSPRTAGLFVTSSLLQLLTCVSMAPPLSPLPQQNLCAGLVVSNRVPVWPACTFRLGLSRSAPAFKKTLPASAHVFCSAAKNLRTAAALRETFSRMALRCEFPTIDMQMLFFEGKVGPCARDKIFSATNQMLQWQQIP